MISGHHVAWSRYLIVLHNSCVLLRHCNADKTVVTALDRTVSTAPYENASYLVG